MVRNFGERRKKNKRGQLKKAKSRKPNTGTPQEADKGYEGIPQEEVTCREVAIYVPRPGQVDEKPFEKQFDNKPRRNEPEVNKNNNNSYRSKREQRSKNRRPREARNVYYDNYDDDEHNDDLDDQIARMMCQFGGSSFMMMELGRFRGMSFGVCIPLAMMMGMRH